MEIRFVDENHCFGRSLRDEIAQLVLRRDAGGGIVWITHVNQAALCSSDHFRKIVRKAARQRNLHNFGTVGAGIIEYCFKGRICGDKLSVLGSSKCFSAELENFSRTIAQQNLIATNAV